MSSAKSPNARGVDAPGRRKIFSMCGMCAVRCPIEVTTEDGRVAWIQGNAQDEVAGTSLCARGSAGIAFEYDDERPQTPLIRTGARGAGRWRRATWDEALDHVADKLKEVIADMGGKGVALSDRGGPFTDLTRTFLHALGSPNYLDHDASCGRNAHNAARSLYGVGRTAITPWTCAMPATSCSTAAIWWNPSRCGRRRNSWRRWPAAPAVPILTHAQA